MKPVFGACTFVLALSVLVGCPQGTNSSPKEIAPKSEVNSRKPNSALENAITAPEDGNPAKTDLPASTEPSPGKKVPPIETTEQPASTPEENEIVSTENPKSDSGNESPTSAPEHETDQHQTEPRSAYIEFENLAGISVNDQAVEAFQEFEDEGLFAAVNRMMEHHKDLRYPIAILRWRPSYGPYQFQAFFWYRYYIAPLLLVKRDMEATNRGEPREGEWFYRPLDYSGPYSIVRILKSEPRANWSPIPFDCQKPEPLQLKATKGQARCAKDELQDTLTSQKHIKCFYISRVAAKNLTGYQEERRAFWTHSKGFSYEDEEEGRLHCGFYTLPWASGI